MARGKSPKTEIIETPIASDAAQTLAQTQNVISSIEGLAQADLMLAIESIVKSKVHRGYEEFSRINRIIEMRNVKESKAYRSLKGLENPNDRKIMDGTWEEYCTVLGMSVDKADIDIKNLNEFGSDALDVMDKAGIGYAKMKMLRKLPDDEKSALIEVAKSGDTSALVEFTEIICEKHAKEKTALQENITELEKNHQTQGEILAEVKDENTRLKLELKKLKPGTKMWHEAIAPLKEEIAHHQTFVDESLARHLEAVEAIDAWITAEVTSKPDYDPEAELIIPTQAITVLLQLDECINRSANLVAAARNHLQNEYGSHIAEARRLQLEETTEE